MSIDRICTIGPSCDSKKALEALMKHGMTIARLNMSHGTHESHAEVISFIKELNDEKNENIKILADLQGPKIRLGKVEGERVILQTGHAFTLSIEEGVGNEKEASVDYEGLVKDVKPGDRILINDGAVELKVKDVDQTAVSTEIISGGEISSNKGVNLPGIETHLPAITEKDKRDIQFLLGEGIDFLACSFVRRAAHLEEVRKFIGEMDAKSPLLIAKIETIQAVYNFREICDEANAVMIARGDLGVELPFEWIPLLQKAMIHECSRKGIFVITATQMLQSMVESPLPTRAEVTDVFQAALDGTSAVMLSAESAVGNYPNESVETLTCITAFAENIKKTKTFGFDDMIALMKTMKK
jgi:pyruvate kinase